MNPWCDSRAEELLCQAVAATDPGSRCAAAEDLRRELGDDDALEFAKVNEVDGTLAEAIISQRGRDAVPQSWRAAHDDVANTIRDYLAELDRVAALLAAEGIPLVALKNGGIARGVYPHPACCPMGDLDVLVEKRHFRQAHRRLLADGYEFEFRNPLEEAVLDEAEKHGGGEYKKRLPGGRSLWFELQWRPVAGRWIRPDQEPPAEELLARSAPIAGTAVRLLSPEDNLLQVCLHTAKHSYVRAPGFRLHTDVDRIARFQLVDWDLFLDRVRRMQVRTAVYLALLMPREMFATPIPDAVLAALRPAAWKARSLVRRIRRAGVFTPLARKFSKPGYIAFNMLLYDNFGGLWRGMFPDPAWMRSHYGFRNRLLLPYYHGRRLWSLAFRRVST